MADFQRRKKVRRILYSPLSIIILSVAVLLMARGAWNIWQKERIAASEARAARTNLAALQARQAGLSEEITELKSDRGVEAEIREKFGATKPGEGAIVIVDGEQPAESPATTTSWWRKFLDIF